MDERKHYRITFHGAIDIMANSEREAKEKFNEDFITDEEILDAIDLYDLEVEEINSLGGGKNENICRK